MAACRPEPLPVVATGRWVEFATARDEPICAGTITLLDGLVQEAFAFLGEVPPDDVFIRYEWVDPNDPTSPAGGVTKKLDDGSIRIRSISAIEEHEIAHAAHQTAWPRSIRFFHEGLAVLLDGRRIYDPGIWPQGADIDALLEDPLDDGEHYYEAWFFMSQVLRDHGRDGLRDLWHAVPAGSSAQQVRAAYQSLFGRSLDALFEPAPSAYDPEFLWKRPTCLYTLCPGPVQTFAPPVLSVPGPTSCTDDPHAVGPDSRGATIDGPAVWRETIVEAGAPIYFGPIDQGLVIARPCFLWCTSNLGLGWIAIEPGVDSNWGLPEGRWRIEVRREPEDFPLDPFNVEILDQSPR